MTFDLSAFQVRLKFLRELRNWSTRDVALALTWQSSAYADIENNRKRCTIADLMLIAALYKVPPEFLLEGCTKRLAPEIAAEIESYVSRRRAEDKALTAIG